MTSVSLGAFDAGLVGNGRNNNDGFSRWVEQALSGSQQNLIY
jgi:hypothetical protein